MADLRGFLKVKRKSAAYRPVCERVRDYRSVALARPDEQSAEQASRCMDCGTPFCNWGCSIGNYIPEWNDLVFRGQWRRAYELLAATNELPEITGRVCPAACEYSCVLSINDEAVTIRENELAIIEHAFKQGWVKPQPPKQRSGKKVAVIGSGPAGLVAAAQLNRLGHKVVVFERDDNIGGMLRYGIPDFKLEKWILDRRLAIWKKEGVKFKTNVFVSEDYPIRKIVKQFDAVCLACGCRQARDLNIPGRNLQGIHFAMDYLTQANRKVAGKEIAQEQVIDAKGKKVIVIGGGDTGADCLGTAQRQGASCVVQIELLPKPAECRTEDYPWPVYPMLLKTSSSYEEGGVRHWSVLTKRFIGKNNRVHKLSCVKIKLANQGQRTCPTAQEIPGSDFTIAVDLVILAVGFVHPEHNRLIKDLAIELDARGNVNTDKDYMTRLDGVFAAGDMHRGQSLVVWALFEGRSVALAIDRYLS